MAGGKHVVVWPKVRVVAGKGERITLEKGQLVPAGVSDVDLANLVSFGAIAGVTVDEPAADAPEAKSDKVDDILAEVGDDKDKAAAALETEKAGKNRPTLVKALEAIANPS